MTTGKGLTRQTFLGKVMSLLFNMLSRLVIVFLPRSKRLLISWLQSPPAVILEPPKIKSVTVSIVSPFICHEVMGPAAMIIVFWMLSFKSTFSLSSFTFKRLFRSSLLLSWKWCHLCIWGYSYFSQQSGFQIMLHPTHLFAWYTLHIDFLSMVFTTVHYWTTSSWTTKLTPILSQLPVYNDAIWAFQIHGAPFCLKSSHRFFSVWEVLALLCAYSYVSFSAQGKFHFPNMSRSEFSIACSYNTSYRFD